MVSPAGHPLYVAYAMVMLLTYVATAVYGYLLREGEVSPPERYRPESLRLWGTVVLSAGVVLSLVFLFGLVAPKRPWGWGYKLVLICFGLSSPCTWPVTIPLLRRWCKPDMKRYYRMR